MKKKEHNYKNCMFIGKGSPYKFHGPSSSSAIHLVDDIEMVSVVLTRRMFFFKRYMRTLKRYVQQKAHPKGCMAEGYILNEAFLFLCEFLGKDYEDGPRIWDEARAAI